MTDGEKLWAHTKLWAREKAREAYDEQQKIIDEYYIENEALKAKISRLEHELECKDNKIVKLKEQCSKLKEQCSFERERSVNLLIQLKGKKQEIEKLRGRLKNEQKRKK